MKRRRSNTDANVHPIEQGHSPYKDSEDKYDRIIKDQASRGTMPPGPGVNNYAILAHKQRMN